jgi:hypothetical protein
MSWHVLTSRADGETVSKIAPKAQRLGAFLVSGEAIMRDVKAIDRDIEIESQWWKRECRRTGNAEHPDSVSAFARLDQLLEERFATTSPQAVTSDG